MLAVGFAVLAALTAGAGRRAVALVAAGGVALVGALLALDAADRRVEPRHSSVGDGPGELAADLGDRLELSWERATASVSTGVMVWAGLAVLAVLVLRAGAPRTCPHASERFRPRSRPQSPPR